MIQTEKADWDLIFRALASEERRTVLRTLFERNGELAVEELATELTADEATDGGTDEAVSAYLHHTALPTLASAGLVDWEPTERTVSLNALAYRLPIGTVTPQLVPPQTAAPQQRADD
ncbi:hypothetical protein ACFQGE_18680 [Halomicroarcula sp. GCM10025817]|jgi:DNA-binding transcriptional ArsR family regulator|uniref:DUF7344 domain-containing protein n=1 Tax=Haloarcula TaxID=2237 RepID=UPI0023E8EC9C|nr:hypothetical protein [Halomicroarcula sp. SYNS111]